MRLFLEEQRQTKILRKYGWVIYLRVALYFAPVTDVERDRAKYIGLNLPI